jgi:two-component SAPR family response regulator
MPKRNALGLRPPEIDARRILILEDEYFLADDCAKAVARCGMQVIGPFADAANALQALKGNHPDGAIIDINLRGVMAYPVADVLQDRSVPFVFYTGYVELNLPKRFANVIRVAKPESPGIAVRELLKCIKRSSAVANASPSVAASKAHPPTAARSRT